MTYSLISSSSTFLSEIVSVALLIGVIKNWETLFSNCKNLPFIFSYINFEFEYNIIIKFILA